MNITTSNSNKPCASSTRRHRCADDTTSRLTPGILLLEVWSLSVIYYRRRQGMRQIHHCSSRKPRDSRRRKRHRKESQRSKCRLQERLCPIAPIEPQKSTLQVRGKQATAVIPLRIFPESTDRFKNSVEFGSAPSDCTSCYKPCSGTDGIFMTRPF